MKVINNVVDYVLGWVSDLFIVNIEQLSDNHLEHERMVEMSEGGHGEIWQEELDRRSKGGM